MKKNSLRYKALKRCAQINENVAVDLLKLKRSGVDVKNFINQVENINAPYSILEKYNFMSIDDVDLEDIKESLMELGATRKLLSEAVYKTDDKGDSYTLRVGDSYIASRDNISTSGVSEEERKRIAKVDKIDDIWWRTFDNNTFFSEIDTIMRAWGNPNIKTYAEWKALLHDIGVHYAKTLLDNGINSIEYWKILLNYLRDSKNEGTGWFDYIQGKFEKKFPDHRVEDIYEVLRQLVNDILAYLRTEIKTGSSLKESKNGLAFEADDVLINKAIEFINKSIQSSPGDVLHRRKNLPNAEYIEDENGLYRNDNSPYMRLLISTAMRIGYTLYKKYGIDTKNNLRILDDYFRDLIYPKNYDEYNEIERDLISWTLGYLRDLIYGTHKDVWQRREKMIARGEDIDESYSFKNRRKMLKESKKELDSKADLKKRQAELDKIVEEIKNDANLDKKSAKKYTTRLKKIKDLKELKKAKSIVKKLSKLYPEAADLLNESMVLKIVNAVRGKKSVLNENLKINNFHISTYSLKELKECYSKVAKNINVLKRKLKKCSLNESYTASDIRKIKEELKKQTKLYGMLDEEISWKMLILQKGGLDNVRFLNEGEDSKEDKNTDEDSASTSLDDLFNNIGDDMEDDIDKEEKSDKKDEDKNDSDEDVELDSITITMKSEDAANGLKDALIEKGVPEDVIDIEEAEDEEDESKNESVKYSNKFMRLFEDEETDDSDNKDDEDNSDDSNNDNSDDSNNDSDNDNTDDKAYNVTLTDTDYVNSLKDVMVDEYGYTEDEFWDSIGGKPVDDEDDSDKDKDKDDEDDSDNKDDEDDDTSELDSIGADIFGEQ